MGDCEWLVALRRALADENYQSAALGLGRDLARSER